MATTVEWDETKVEANVHCFAERGKTIRLISARKATRTERKKHEEEDLS